MKPNILELINARLFHDFATTVNSIDSFIHLMTHIDNIKHNEITDLLQISSKSMISKLRLYRMIYSVSSSDEATDLEDCFILIKDFFANSKVKFHYVINKCNSAKTVNISNSITKSKIDRGVARIFLCAVHIAADLISMRGTIDCNVKEDLHQIYINAIADYSIVNHYIEYEQDIGANMAKSFLNDNKKDNIMITLSNCLQKYLVNLCKELGYTISVDLENEKEIKYLITRIMD